jgi:hypothetical protein
MGLRTTSLSKTVITGGALLMVLVACAEGHCRKTIDHPSEPKDVAESVPPVSAAEATGRIAKANEAQHVFVFKHDGSLQCGRGKAIAVDVMEKQLAGITVYSREKKSDGMMHIQACGTITGMTNVYEIAQKDLKKAEAKGFKLRSAE